MILMLMMIIIINIIHVFRAIDIRFSELFNCSTLTSCTVIHIKNLYKRNMLRNCVSLCFRAMCVCICFSLVDFVFYFVSIRIPFEHFFRLRQCGFHRGCYMMCLCTLYLYYTFIHCLTCWGGWVKYAFT